MKRLYFFLILLLGAALTLGLLYLRNVYLFWTLSPTERAIETKEGREARHFRELHYRLVDPNEAPEVLRNTILQGYNIMMDTPAHAKEYAGNKLSCTNCHFAGGNTTGGVNGSISLAGIAAVYPSYNKRAESVITLTERINNCFMRSLNGKPLPCDSDEMVALVTYLQWISKGYPIYGPLPWRGLKKIVSDHTPDPEKGKELFVRCCAKCHGDDGQGQIRIPPLWGSECFNDGAGMNQLDTLAAFIHSNMPYENPDLTEEESLDVAAYIRTRPRPEFK